MLRGHDSFGELPQFVGLEVSGNKIAPRAQEATITVRRFHKLSAPLGVRFKMFSHFQVLFAPG